MAWSRTSAVVLAIIGGLLSACGPHNRRQAQPDPFAALLPVRSCQNGNDLVRLPDGVLAQRVRYAMRNDGGPTVEYRRFDLSAKVEEAC